MTRMSSLTLSVCFGWVAATGCAKNGKTAPPGSNVQAYPTQHPKIYVNANAARLKASLSANQPAATRFKSVVDSWVNGSDLWGFESWNGALMGQLTGDPKYCRKAVAVVEAQVADAEASTAERLPTAAPSPRT